MDTGLETKSKRIWNMLECSGTYLGDAMYVPKNLPGPNHLCRCDVHPQHRHRKRHCREQARQHSCIHRGRYNRKVRRNPSTLTENVMHTYTAVNRWVYLFTENVSESTPPRSNGVQSFGVFSIQFPTNYTSTNMNCCI